ncbi:hypothetical protein XELAEV_18022425mg [Xenopus laevis]|uniref:Secreted protein n=1 Tax=Xenopus laevis TaxID=8355 RepID=A0A974HN70_XENLA|nr:hypothetical protein XELAEV_18022425mg [Xenopus laevis]
METLHLSFTTYFVMLIVTEVSALATVHLDGRGKLLSNLRSQSRESPEGIPTVIELNHLAALCHDLYFRSRFFTTAEPLQECSDPSLHLLHLQT